MKTNKSLPKPLILVASAMVWCGLNLHAQTGPTITNQPASQTNLPGTTVSFSVAVTGTGPFSYQWQFNGTNLPTNIITTVAGKGTAGYSGDGGLATNASLNAPRGVGVDAAGNLYIGDTLNSRIRKVDANGIITTLTAGAAFGLVLDASGTVYFADSNSHLIRKVDTNGITTIVAGNGSGTYAGDGGAATNASLHSPYAVALDTYGNLYIADSGNNRIRKVDSNGIITTVAGNGSGTYAGDGGAATNASLYGPVGVVFEHFGNLIIAESGNNRIRKMDTNGMITTVAGNGTNSYSGDGGAATNASLNTPYGLTFDAVGNLFIADFWNNRIRKVDTNGIITTVAGIGTNSYSGDGGAATNTSLYNPIGVACDAYGNLFIADWGNSRIRKVDTNGIITTVAGNGIGKYAGDRGAATNASLNFPNGVAFDAYGNLFIADSWNNRIRKVDTNGIITTVAGKGAVGFQIGSYSGDGGAATNANLYNPTGVAFDAYGNQYIADYNNQRVRKVDTNGIITTVAGRGPSGYDSGSYSGDGGAATNASLYQPRGVACDASGNLYIGDSFNNRVREVDLAGHPALTLNNIGATNAGNYTVIVTSPYGSVTSAVATLTVTIPPQIIASGTSFGFVSNQFGFNISGTTNQTIVVDGSTNLVTWTPLYTNTANGNPFYFFDPAWTNFSWRFYRARLSQ
jgi:sugar lactone lactonase YvrE